MSFSIKSSVQFVLPDSLSFVLTGESPFARLSDVYCWIFCTNNRISLFGRWLLHMETMSSIVVFCLLKSVTACTVSRTVEFPSHSHNFMKCAAMSKIDLICRAPFLLIVRPIWTLEHSIGFQVATIDAKFKSFARAKCNKNIESILYFAAFERVLWRADNIISASAPPPHTANK